MRLTEILTPDQRVRYVVLDDEGCLVEPIARYLKHLDQRGYARNTLRSYGTSLQLYFEYLNQKGLDFRQITIDDLASCVQWLKLPSRNVKVLPSRPVAQARANRTINHTESISPVNRILLLLMHEICDLQEKCSRTLDRETSGL